MLASFWRRLYELAAARLRHNLKFACLVKTTHSSECLSHIVTDRQQSVIAHDQRLIRPKVHRHAVAFLQGIGDPLIMVITNPIIKFHLLLIEH